MAKIIGNTTATPNPKPDWNQTDETRADYIKNKPAILTETDVFELIDKRCCFNSFALAKAAAATAEEVGSTNTVYYYGMKLMVDDGSTVKWYTIQRDRSLLEDGTGGSSSGTSFETDNTLTLENGVLKVNTADKMEANNTLPITSAGVYAQIGNIEILLGNI